MHHHPVLHLSLSLSLAYLSRREYMVLRMGDAEIARIDRQSSIENEPRTLDFRQLQFARDAAQYVMNTTNIEEALRIFTQGLERVESVAKQDGRRIMDIGEEFDCSVNEVGILGSRDVASAPF